MKGTRLVDANTVAEMTGWTAQTVRLKARRGDIPAVKVGYRTLFVPEQIESWLRDLPKAAT